MEDENDGAQERQSANQPEGEGNHEQEDQAACAEEQVAGAGADATGEGEAAGEDASAEQVVVVSEAEWTAMLDAKDAEMADMKLGYELQLAGARNVKAAKALLSEHDGDIAALKASEPWLFQDAAVDEAELPQGATGLPNAGAAADSGATLKRWRALAGLDSD